MYLFQFQILFLKTTLYLIQTTKPSNTHIRKIYFFFNIFQVQVCIGGDKICVIFLKLSGIKKKQIVYSYERVMHIS